MTKTPSESTERAARQPKRNSGELPIVGIGASAGGIEALARLFDAMPSDSGMAFIIVLHLDPTHESQLASIVRQHTAMPVAEIEDGMLIEADHVYVITPDAYLRVADNTCRLTKPEQPRGHRFPVDVLFASLAEEKRERAICIVLSGTGHNGTQGLREVKAQGGCSLVQDPETAKFDGMPRSAIAADVADQVMGPEKMPAFLMHYIRHAYMAAPAVIETAAAEALTLDRILALLGAQSNHDFRSYKRSTLMRRIRRRMGLQNLDTLEDYFELLRSRPVEVLALIRDILINVTGFFRDTEAWRALDETVIEPLVAERSTGESIRFWVPACATGEEAYSLGMVFTERAEAAGKKFDLKIFATDSQDANLNVARSGVNPAAATAPVSPGRLRRFFNQLDGAFEVSKELRELVIFSPHNLLRDPPFSRMDLISCRNLLIYLQPEAQKRVIALSHFALRAEGHLFLGSAETIGREDDLFETISKKWRIYRRIGPTRHDIIDFPLFSGPARPHEGEDKAVTIAPAEAPIRYAEVARRTLLERHAPAAVLIDQRGRTLYFHGPTSNFLQLPTGEPTRDLLSMAREGLRTKLRVALRQATDESKEAEFVARVRQNGTQRSVAVTVTPTRASGHDTGLLLVSFTAQRDPPATAETRLSNEEASKLERVLEEELQSVRTELRISVEQMESVHEELKAYNEETTSMNEELQSTNEELETSKEELQSYNEELHSVNNQLQHKIQELEVTTNTLDNLLAGTEIATVFLDSELRIKWFSPASKKLLDLAAADIGRPIGHFALKIADKDLVRDAEIVLADLASIDAEAPGDSGRWYLRRMLPYRTRGNHIEGVVINYTDITERKQVADAIDEARVFSEAIVKTIRQPLVVLDADLRVTSANPVFYEMFKVSPNDTEGRPLFELGNGQWDIPQLRILLEDILPENDQFSDLVVDHVFQGIGAKTMLLNARRLRRNGGRPGLILLAIEDTTERTRADAHRERLVEELSHRVKNTLATVQSLATRTLRQATTLDQFWTAFDGRLQALARAYDLLVAENWTGADIGQLARWTLEPYRVDGDERITIEGPKLILTPKAGTAMVMILHELATNAAKYGALATPTGRLNVKWDLRAREGDREFKLSWTETGGQRVEPPTRQGFGTRLIEGSAAYELKGSAKLDFRAEGLHCRVTFPWDTAGAPEQEAE